MWLVEVVAVGIHRTTTMARESFAVVVFLLRVLWSAHSLSIDISTFVRWAALVPLLYCQGYCALGACAALAALSIDGSRSVAVSSVPSFLAPSYHPATYVVYVVRFTWTSIGRRTFSSLLPLVGLCSVVVPCAPFPILLADQHLPPPHSFCFIFRAFFYHSPLIVIYLGACVFYQLGEGITLSGNVS